MLELALAYGIGAGLGALFMLCTLRSERSRVEDEAYNRGFKDGYESIM